MYDKPLTVTHSFSGVTLSSAVDLEITGPSGATGVIRGVHVRATTTFNGGQALHLGTAADDDAYMDWTPTATLVAGEAEFSPDTEGVSGVWKDRTVPADTPIRLTNSANWTTAGAADIEVIIDWNKAQERVSYA